MKRSFSFSFLARSRWDDGTMHGQRLSANYAGAEITRLDMTKVRVSRMSFWRQEMSAIGV